jgi:hypothetical protein
MSVAAWRQAAKKPAALKVVWSSLESGSDAYNYGTYIAFISFGWLPTLQMAAEPSPEWFKRLDFGFASETGVLRLLHLFSGQSIRYASLGCDHLFHGKTFSTHDFISNFHR